MKPAVTAVPATPSRPIPSPPELAFPPRATLPTLRTLCETHFREGRHDLALRVATEVARRAPGRESCFRLGFMYREVGRYRESLKALRRALRFESGPAYLVAEIHLHIAYTWFLLRKGKRMAEALRRAYALRPKPRTAFNFHTAYGAQLFSLRKFREAAQEYARAEAAAPNAMNRGRAAVNQGNAALRQGLLAEARQSLDRGLMILKRGKFRAELAVARTIRGALCFDEGQYRRAMGMYLNAARGFRQMGKVDREAEALVNAGYSAGELNLWPRSRALLDRAISLASNTGQYNVLSPAYALRATACAFHEDFEEAAGSLAQAERLLKGRRDWVASLHVYRAQGRVAALLGHWQEVLRATRSAERLSVKVGDLPRVAEFRKIRAAAEQRLGRTRAATQALNTAKKVEALLGRRSIEMRRIAKIAPKLASSDLPILIVGESGCGLVSMAKEIHVASKRAKRPAVVVACEQLVFPASDLHGHAEGAWSGAVRGSLGLVSEAAGGTLILDRVDQLSEGGQRVLLRIVEGKLRPVGSADEMPIDLRVIATCRCADAILPDLRHRLEGAVIRLPELHERKEEIVKAVRGHLAGRRRISPDALAELARHKWEGDLPQVRATVERLVALSEEFIGCRLVRSALTSTETRGVARRVAVERRSLLTASGAR